MFCLTVLTLSEMEINMMRQNPKSVTDNNDGSEYISWHATIAVCLITEVIGGLRFSQQTQKEFYSFSIALHCCSHCLLT